MKFGSYLEANAIPEWREKYVHYKRIKKAIKKNRPAEAPAGARFSATARFSLTANVPAAPSGGVCMEDEWNIQCDVYDVIREDLDNINKFYRDRENEALARYEVLRGQVQAYKAASNREGVRKDKEKDATKSDLHLPLGNLTVPTSLQQFPREFRELPLFRIGTARKKWLQQLKKAFREYYRGLTLLYNYQLLNYTAFVKILKKHDKTFGANSEKFVENLENEPFRASKTIKNLEKDTENLYADVTGSHKQASMELRMPSNQTYEWATFRLGFYIGMFVPIVGVIVFEVSRTWGSLPYGIAVLRMFRGLFLPSLLLWLFGIDMLVWTRTRINYLFIFEKDPRRSLSYHQTLELASGLMLVIMLGVLLYLMCSVVDGFTPPEYIPLLVACCLVVFILWPFAHPARGARYWILAKTLRIITAPFHAVQFPDFWLADQFVSLEMAFLDWEYLICFYVHDIFHPGSDQCNSVRYAIRPIISMLPSWWRTLQCLRRYKDAKVHRRRHLVNAGKYSTTFFVVIFATLDNALVERTGDKGWNSYRVVWFAFCLINALYGFVWDVYMDWGLFHKKSKKIFLRDLLVMAPIYYYVAIVLDFILRFVWMAPLLPNDLLVIAFGHAEGMKTVAAVCGVLRRGMWNIFRLENEHLHNVGEFRTVHEVPLPPLPQDEMDANSLENNENSSSTPTSSPCMRHEGGTQARKRKTSWLGRHLFGDSENSLPGQAAKV